MKRILAMASAGLALLFGGVALAAPASAVNYTYGIHNSTKSKCPLIGQIGINGPRQYIAPGDTWVVNALAGSVWVSTYPGHKATDSTGWMPFNSFPAAVTLHNYDNFVCK